MTTHETISKMVYEALCAPFQPDAVSWRVGSTNKEKTKGLALAYIDARDVMRRLDDVVGFDGWSTHDRKDGDTYYCEMTLTVNGRAITKTGAAGATDVEGEKGGASDALKRAAVLFGIGRYLYDTPSTWVEIEPMGNSWKIKASEYAKLRKVLGGIKVTEIEPEKPQQDNVNVPNEASGKLWELLRRAEMAGNKTDFDIKFLSDMQKKYADTGESTSISAKQLAVLQKIADKPPAKKDNNLPAPENNMPAYLNDEVPY